MHVHLGVLPKGWLAKPVYDLASMDQLNTGQELLKRPNGLVSTPAEVRVLG